MEDTMELENKDVLREARRLSKLQYSPSFTMCLKIAIKKLTKLAKQKEAAEFAKVRNEYEAIITSVFQSCIKMENCYFDSHKIEIYKTWLDADFNLLFAFTSNREKFEKFALGDTGSVYCFGYDQFQNDKEAVRDYLISRAHSYDMYQ